MNNKNTLQMAQEIIKNYENVVKMLQDHIDKLEKFNEYLQKVNDKYYRALKGEYTAVEAMGDLLGLIDKNNF